MPVILNKEEELAWLNPASDPVKLQEYLKPYPDENMVLQPDDKQLRFSF